MAFMLFGCSHQPEIHNEALAIKSQRIVLPAEFTAAKTNIDGQLDTSESINALASQFLPVTVEDDELQTLIQKGLANNPNLAVTASLVNDAFLFAQITQSSRYPGLNLGLSGARAKTGEIRQQSIINNNFNLNLNSQWELDLWGKLKNQTRADYQEAYAAELDLQFAKLSLAANIARTYFNLITEKEVLKLRQQSHQNTQRIEKITEYSFKRGLVTALDVQLARRDLASTKQRELSQENTLITVARNLNGLVGEYPDRDSYISAYADSRLPTELYDIQTGIPADILTRRPDILSSLSRIRAAELDYAAARKTLLPAIALTSSGGTSSNELSDLLDGNFSVWSLISNVTYPLLNRKRLTNSVKLADNNLARQIDTLDVNLLSALQEVENGLDTEQSLHDQVQALQIARDYAEQSARRARTQYESGLVDANTLLTTQNQFFSAEETLLRTRNALLQNRITLYLALGGNISDTTIQTTQN